MVLSPNAPTEVLTMHPHKRVHLVIVNKKKKKKSIKHTRTCCHN